MPSGSSRRPRPPRPPGPNRKLKSDAPRRPQQKRPPKPFTSPSDRRSAPGTLQQVFVYPVTPLSDFLPLAIDLTPPADYPASNHNPAYDVAIARLQDLVAETTITTNQSKLLAAAMNTAQSFVAPGEVHPLLHTISSPSTPTSEILELVAIIDAGMRAFVAQPGPSASTNTAIDPDPGSGTASVASSSGSRSDAVKTACAFRDNRTCVVTGAKTGVCCHIIPYSVKGDKARNFWAFVSMFKGPAATLRLKRMTLGRDPWGTDNIRNVLWLALDTHSCFDKGELAIVPVVPSAEYDPATVSEYTARVEIPYGADSVDLVVRTTDPSGGRKADFLTAGHTITLRTSNPATHPLPHPLLFQLHTAFTRLRKMCASAGIPILPPNHPASDDGAQDLDLSAYDYDYASEPDSQDLPDDTAPENNIWPVSSARLPLKERYLQLLCGSEASEADQYYNVIDHWTAHDDSESDVDMRDTAMVVPERKRLFALLDRDWESASERSRPASEVAPNKRRWDCQEVSGAGCGGGERWRVGF